MESLFSAVSSLQLALATIQNNTVLYWVMMIGGVYLGLYGIKNTIVFIIMLIKNIRSRDDGLPIWWFFIAIVFQFTCSYYLCNYAVKIDRTSCSLMQNYVNYYKDMTGIKETYETRFTELQNLIKDMEVRYKEKCE